VQQIEQEVTAQATAIASVHKALAREAGDFAQAKMEEALANGDEEGAKLWGEGGAARTAVHAVTGALTGNLAGAVGAAAGSLAAPVLSMVQDGITNILKDAGASDTVAKETGKIVASIVAGTGGAVIAGSKGAAGAFNVETFNRQLTHSEKQLAKELADKSNGKYTPEQIEEQMRGMTVTQNGKTEQGIPDVLVSGVPTDNDSRWDRIGTTTDGKPILIQLLAPENLELRAYIVQNTTGTGVPGTIMYDGPFAAPAPAQPQTRQLSTARCANGDYNCAAGLPLPLTEAEKQRRLNTAADVASSVSTQSGRVSAAATAYGTVLSISPNPFSQAAAATQFSLATGATIVDFSAQVVEQLLRPNVGKQAIASIVETFNTGLGNKFPLWGPIVNEATEASKSSTPANKSMEEINKLFGDKR